MVRAGQRLKDRRVKSGLTLEEVARATKIKTQFLLAIENGEYEKLPSATYCYGFVKNYAKFLGLPEKETLAVFKREHNLEKTVGVLPEGLSREKEFRMSRFRLSGTGKIVVFIFIALLGYLLFQYRYTIINPPLEVSSPKENEVVFSKTVEVVGKTDPNGSVFINSELVSVDGNGNFKKTISLFIGKTTVTIKAVNYFGKETIIERQIEVKEDT